jgi:16S rRNA (guanine1207-N2)-methyltransferase
MSHSFLTATSALLAQTAAITPGDQLLLLHSADPALARVLVEAVSPAGQVTALHTSYAALETLARVPGLIVSEAVYPDPAVHGPADAALLDIPKGREHTRAYLWAAAHTLRPGGRLLLAGANDGGAKSAIRDAAELFGSAPVLGYKGGCRIAQALRPDVLRLPPAWEQVAQTQTRTVERPEGTYTLITMPGVFSWDHLDDGTALLLDQLHVEPETDVLDIGCGGGIIGLVAARAGARVVMVDDDLLAVRCARASAHACGLADRCRVLPSDVTRAIPDHRFDLILSNPPFHAGIDVTTGTAHRIIREAFEHLRPGGILRIVANRFLPYDRVLNEAFGSSRIVAETGRFYVLEALKK